MTEVQQTSITWITSVGNNKRKTTLKQGKRGDLPRLFEHEIIYKTIN